MEQIEEFRLGERLLIFPRVLEQEQQRDRADDGDPQNPRARRHAKFAALLGFFIVFSHEY